MKNITTALTLLTSSIFIMLPAQATDQEQPKSYSVSGQHAQNSKEQRLKELSEKFINKQDDQQQKRATYLPREQHQLLKQTMANKQTRKAMISPQKSAAFYSFSIYEGYAQLIEDYDEDGYFQTFSVTFDADVITASVYDEFTVYADLYLSKNGGPWIHYFTTDPFNIYGESTDDVYEVYTTLEQGYITNEYDVLIDLYEVGYEDVVASYSSDDTNDLYALPLESSDYDPEYVVYHSESHGHGGNMPFSLLALLSFIMIYRRLHMTKTK
ncbi:choice-of-anchor H family protein [Thalassotalea ganghwensis]